MKDLPRINKCLPDVQSAGSCAQSRKVAQKRLEQDEQRRAEMHFRQSASNGTEPLTSLVQFVLNGATQLTGPAKRQPSVAHDTANVDDTRSLMS